MSSWDIVWMIGVSMLMLLAGCAAPSPGTPAGEPTAATIAEAPLPPTPLPTFTPLPIVEPTATPSPPAKLTVEELSQQLDPLGGGNSCPLPCYGGLMVGQANLNDALEFYSKLGIGTSDLMPGDYDDVRSGTGHLHAWLNKASDQAEAQAAGYAPPLVDIVLQDGLVHQLYIGWSQLPDILDAARIVGALGEPDVLEGAVIQDEEVSTYMLRLIYTTHQADLVYYGSPVTGAGFPQICVNPDTVQQVLFGVWELETGPIEGFALSDHLRPAEESLGASKSDVTARLGTGQCLDIPATP
ncbi:MAG: hypothetical protein JXJ17_07870 [Anaerolineae bacterium]|nr:hypothetical protein [Anaerolineae bacterium]